MQYSDKSDASKPAKSTGKIPVEQLLSRYPKPAPKPPRRKFYYQDSNADLRGPVWEEQVTALVDDGLIHDSTAMRDSQSGEWHSAATFFPTLFSAARGAPTKPKGKKLLPPPKVGNPTTIGGWLLIPAIGLVLSPIISTLRFFAGLSLINQVASEWLFDFRLLLTALIDLGIISFTVVTAIFFFRRSHTARKLMIWLLSASIVASIAQSILVISLTGDLSGELAAILGPVIYGAIWIPYFVVSKRVKQTFRI